MESQPEGLIIWYSFQGRSYVEAMEAVASSLFGSYNYIHNYNCQTFNILTFPGKIFFPELWMDIVL